MKKVIYALVAVMLLASLLAGCAAPAPKTPIKIGYVGPMTGFYSHGGIHSTQGMKLAFDEANWEVAGRPIKLIIEDDGWDVGVGIQKAKKLVLSDNVDLLSIMNGQVILALRDFLIEHKMLVISPIADDAALTRDKYFRYFFRANHDAVADRYHVAGYIAYKKGYRNMIAMAPDFVPGRECVQGFKEVFEPLGGKVSEEIYTPFGVTDFAPYFAKIDPATTDAVYAFFFGGDAITFVKQWAEYGLKNRVQLLGIGITDGAILGQEGDAALGVETVANYSSEYDTPVNKAFVKAYEEKYGMDIDFHADLGYVTAKLYLIGLKAVKGNTDDVDGMIAAIEKADFEAPRGRFHYGPNHAPIQPVKLRKVEKRADGKLVNGVEEVYPEIEQGWMPPELR